MLFRTAGRMPSICMGDHHEKQIRIQEDKKNVSVGDHIICLQ